MRFRIGVLFLAVIGLFLAAFFLAINQSVQLKIGGTVVKYLYNSCGCKHADIAFERMPFSVCVLNPKECTYRALRFWNDGGIGGDHFFRIHRENINSPGRHNALVLLPRVGTKFVQVISSPSPSHVASKSRNNRGRLAKILDFQPNSHNGGTFFPAPSESRIAPVSASYRIYTGLMPQIWLVLKGELVLGQIIGSPGLTYIENQETKRERFDYCPWFGNISLEIIPKPIKAALCFFAAFILLLVGYGCIRRSSMICVGIACIVARGWLICVVYNFLTY